MNLLAELKWTLSRSTLYFRREIKVVKDGKYLVLVFVLIISHSDTWVIHPVMSYGTTSSNYRKSGKEFQLHKLKRNSLLNVPTVCVPNNHLLRQSFVM